MLLNCFPDSGKPVRVYAIDFQGLEKSGIIFPMSGNQQFLPMSRKEMMARGWDELDVLIITGDAYIDHPAFGAAVIGRVLEADGWRVGIIAQPDWTNPDSLTAMGRPRLFCGITAGNLDSMLSHYQFNPICYSMLY